MKVATAIKLLQELPLDATIAIQVYTKSDLSVMGVGGKEVLTDDEWELAVAIIDKWEIPDMYTCLEQAIDEAKERLTKEAQACLYT